MTLYGTVEQVDVLSAAMVRVRFGGDGLAAFEPTSFTDQYVNALFLPTGSPFDVPFDIDVARAGPAERRPRGRRYTVRRWDPDNRTLWIDFVVHGDVGYAGRWAANARLGDRLQMIDPTGGYAPDPDADWYLMVGDESALPAIGASLERIPAGRTAITIAMVDRPGDEIELDSPGDSTVIWLYRNGVTDDVDALARKVAELEFPSGRVDGFVHGEAAETRAVRRHLLSERNVPADCLSASPYWRRDHTDEQWREIKSAWLADQASDVVAR